MNHERKRLLSIGSFGQATHLSLKALRLYNQLGLLVPSYVDPESSYRYYHVDQIDRARLIRMLRLMDMPLATIRQVLAATPAVAERLVHEHVDELERRTEQARHLVPEFMAYLRQEAPMPHDVQVRTVGHQPIVSINGRVTVDRLDAHIQDSLKTLYAYIAAQDVSPAGPPFGLFHGSISQEEDGPLEVCVPVGRILSGDDKIAARELPAAQLACVVLQGDQCAFPAVLKGYDAAIDWIKRNGYEMADSPREIWHSELWNSTNPSGDRLEIAWPFR